MTNAAGSYCTSKLRCTQCMKKFSNETAQSIPYSAGLVLAVLLASALHMYLFNDVSIL